MRNVVNALLISCLSLSSIPVLGQEQLGAIQDNYNPINASLLNPAFAVDPTPWLDINVVGLGAYLRNNSIYAPNTYALNPETYPEVIARNPQEKVYGYVTANVLGPSFNLAIKEHSIGFHSAARGYAFLKNIPDPTTTLIDEFKDARVPDGRYFARNIRVKSLVWEEYGITYGRVLLKRNKSLLQGGVTVNRLLGANATGFNIKNGELSVTNNEGLLVNLDGRYWYNEPARAAGKGFSGSLGLVLKRMKKDVSNYVPHSVFGSCVVASYRHKFGLSLVDVGGIRFKQNALYKSFDENTNIDSLDNLADVGTAALATSDGRKFTAWLPSAASFQYDLNLERGFYFNAMVTQRVGFPDWYGTERASLYSAGFRFESKVMTVALPFSVHEYAYPQLGFSIRLWSLVLGTDNVMLFLRRQDIYAADVYLYFKVPIFKSPACRKRSPNERKNKGVMEKFLCPVW